MKKLVLFTIAILVLLTACPDEKDPNIIDPDKKTQIFFDNSDGISDVTVYYDYMREKEITTIPAGQISGDFDYDYSPGISVAFFLVYHVSLKSINGFAVNIIPKIGKDQIHVSIDADKSNKIKIPRLDETVLSNEQRLTDNSYILIQNNSSYPVQLLQGSLVLPLDNAGQGSTAVNAENRAVYKIESTPSLVSGYHLNDTSKNIPFPGNLVNFERGWAYSYVFNGAGLSLVNDIEIKIENIVDSSLNNSLPAAPPLPVVTAQDSLLTARWTAVVNADNYEVYLGAGSVPPALPLRTVPGTTTTVVLDGLVNKTVYNIWIRAVNSAGKSDFSLPCRGIPWSDNEIPAAPDRPQIIEGINRVTVLWEECGGASSYEVYMNTSVSRPALPEITTDKNSVSIGDLVNNTIYYFWIRAANSAGFSSYSAIESGTPKIPTAAPDIPSRPLVIAGNRELSVSWQAVGLTEFYEVWLGTTGYSAQAQKYGDDISGTETVITGLVNNTAYYVWLKAKNSAGTSSFSPSASATPSIYIVPPQTPVVASVLPGDTELLVTWQQAEGALCYEVWISRNNNQNDAEKFGADVYDTSVTINNLVNEKVYYIWIRAKNDVGAGNFSAAAAGKPEFSEPPSAINAAPVIVAANGRLNVSWQEAERAGAYEIWLSETDNQQTAVKKEDASDLSAVISGLTNGNMYFVWIKAKNSAGAGGFSPAANGMPIGDMRTVSTVSGNGQLSFSWNAVAGADKYEVYFNTADTMPAAPAHTITETAIAFNGLNNGSNYYLWVKPINIFGSGGTSIVRNGKPIGNIGSITVSPSESGSLALNWASVPGADQYEVFFSTSNIIPGNPSQTVSAAAAEITGLNNGAAYYVWVKPGNSGGSAGASPAANGTPVAAPGNLSVNEHSGKIILNWEDVPYAAGYEVYYSAAASMPLNPSKTVTAPAAEIAVASGVTAYYFWVKTVNSDGKAGNAGPRAMWVSGGYGLYKKNNTDINFISNYNLADAFAYISNNSSNGDKFIIAAGNETLSGRTLEYSGNEIEITLTGYLEERTIQLGTNGNMFRVGNRVTLILNENITLKGRTENTAALVYVNQSGTLIMNDRSKVIQNTITTAGSGGGIYVASGGVFTMNGGTVSGNTAILQGGGVYVSNSGNFTMFGGKIEGNNASQGAGVMTWGTFIMRGGSINDNISQTGGGVAASPGNTFTMHDGIISNNKASNGAGVYSWGDFTMHGGAINGNTAAVSVGYSSGGGLAVNTSGSFTMNGGTISGNESDLSGGAHIMGIFIMNNGFISGNTSLQSGGVGIDATGTFTMNGGVISKNKASLLVGGGIACAGSFTMNGGKISENTASQGGGVYINSDVTFTMHNGTISGNTASSSAGSGFGGGVAAAGTFIMHGGIISGNAASAFNAANGGGIAIISNGIFKKIPFDQESRYSGIIYGFDEEGYDEDGLNLRNTASSGSVFWSGTQSRDNTADRSDHIDSTIAGWLLINN